MNSEFEKRLQALNTNPKISKELINAMVYVHDGLETSSMIAESVFGKRFTNADVFSIFDRIAARHDLIFNAMLAVEDGEEEYE